MGVPEEEGEGEEEEEGKEEEEEEEDEEEEGCYLTTAAVVQLHTHTHTAQSVARRYQAFTCHVDRNLLLSLPPFLRTVVPFPSTVNSLLLTPLNQPIIQRSSSYRRPIPIDC